MAFGAVATGNINAYEQVMTDDRTEKSIQSIKKSQKYLLHRLAMFLIIPPEFHP